MQLPPSPYFNLQPVADGAWAALAREGAGAWSNAGIVDLGGEALVIDTFFTPVAGAGLRNAAEALVGGPVRYVVNTHRHSDHVLGNQAFRDVPVIGTAATRRLIASETTEFVANVRAKPAFLDFMAQQAAIEENPVRRDDIMSFLGELRALLADMPAEPLVLPSVICDGPLTIHGARRSAQFLPLGAAHSPDDAAVYLPAERVLFAGDLAQVGFNSKFSDGDPEGWLRALDQLAGMAIDHVVPGHGTVGAAADLAAMRTYITDLKQLAATVDPAAKEPPAIPERYAAWHSPNVFIENLRFFAARNAKSARRN
ncbi:MAG TPA: MBL fold metallo-hydrolase [Herpetosiphonaceae bacterium]